MKHLDSNIKSRLFFPLVHYWRIKKPGWWPSDKAAWLQRPSLTQLHEWPGHQLPRFVRESQVAMKYLKLLAPLDWDNFPERPSDQAWAGPAPQPTAPLVAAYLVKLDQSLRSLGHLRRYLVEHPALIWVLGFPLVASDEWSWGFDPEASLPSERQFRRTLQTLPNARLQFLLDKTVAALKGELPAHCQFGRQISLDTKHILAWVRQNNAKVYIKEGRFDKNRQPIGDPDCRLGCKRKSNQTKATDAQTPGKEGLPATLLGVGKGEFYWGYASGVVATKVPEWGEFVLAELTQTFDQSDVSYFFPLMAMVERRLGFKPPFGTLDAAFDAHYVYDYFHQAGGFAAVPLVARGGLPIRLFAADGLPLCEAGLPMPVKNTFFSRSHLVPHEQARYGCPLLLPAPSGHTCPIFHKKWPQGGCITTMATSLGARLRYQLDRESAAYKHLYKQRSATERVNALAFDLGIERPKLRNRASITNQNTLIYVLLNLRALQRVRRRKQRLLQLAA